MQLSGVVAGREDRRQAAFVNVWNVIEREKAAGHEQDKLSRIGPDDRFDAPHVSVKERETHEENNGREDLNPEHKLNGDTDDINAHTGCEGFADQKKPARRAPG